MHFARTTANWSRQQGRLRLRLFKKEADTFAPVSLIDPRCASGV